MRPNRQLSVLLSVMLILILSCDNHGKEQQEIKIDPLPSWNEGVTKSAIINFVNDVTDESSKNFFEVTDRIATFDNDGNLWSEQPMYFQLFFAFERIKILSAKHPEWKNEQPFKAVLEDDMESLMEFGADGLIEILMTTHAGNTTEEFEGYVKEWIKAARHPSKQVTYDQLVYQPMLELLRYLRANDFKTYIVSGGGVDFMRAIVAEVYGIPSEQIIGSRIKTEFDFNNGRPIIKRLSEVDFIDDKEGKPINIQKIIGKKPVFASGNSDGDLQMLQYTASGDRNRFMLYLHHTDSVREWSYDRESHIGRLDKGLDIANEKGWTVIDMKSDWKVIYPFELKTENSTH